jgi:hypothetical protein
MKIKYFFISFVIILFYSGCRVTATEYVNYSDGLDRYETIVVVKSVLKSSPTYYRRYDDGYYYSYKGEIDNEYIGYLTYESMDDFYLNFDHNPHIGSIEIYTKKYRYCDSIYLEVIDDYFVDIIVYDYYGNPANRFRVRWSELGY